MRRVAEFRKVGRKDFAQSYNGVEPAELSHKLFMNAAMKETYESLKLPKRATKHSAGYDFFAPFAITLKPGETIKFPTGIICDMDEDVVLMLYPRSGLGFKYRCQLDNTVGVIDADYGQEMWCKLTNDGDKEFTVEKGQAYMQGVFLPYYVTYDDEVDEIRTGGFGSTTK